MFPPTQEQSVILHAVLEEGRSMVVQAAPGAGKTTLLIFLAEAMRRSANGKTRGRLLWLTYNRHLRLDTQVRLKELGLDNLVDCHTYHSFCAAAFCPAPTDEGIRRVVEAQMAPKEYLGVDFDWAVVGLDEAQDLSPLLVDFVQHAMSFVPSASSSSSPAPAPRMLVLGDLHQCVFQWRGSTDRCLQQTACEALFAGQAPWGSAQMLTSFRLHPSITRFLTDVCLPAGRDWILPRPAPKERRRKRKRTEPEPEIGAAGSLSSLVGPDRRVLYLAGEGTARHLATLVRSMMEDPLIGNHQPGRFFVLVPSVRPSAHNPTTAVLVELENQLARLGYPIYNPQTDDDSALLGSVPETRGGKGEVPRAHATEGKIVICTYGQSKGRERDIAIVLGFDAAAYYRGCERDSADAAQMPPRLFVACTRAREYLVVVETAGRGRGRTRTRTRSTRGDSGNIEGPLPFLRMGADGYSGLASQTFMALGLSPGPPPPMPSPAISAVSPVPHPGWVLYHSGTQRPPDLELYGCTPDGSVERVQEQSRAAVGRRGPAAALAPPAAVRFASPDDLTRYWTMDQLSAARTSLAPFVSVQDPAPGPHPTVAFPYRVASAAEHEPGARPGTMSTYTAVADIVCLAVRTVWELLVRPGEMPQAVREVRDRVTPSWSRECLCEAEPALGDRLREDWRSALGAWAQDGRVCVPRSAEELEGVLMVATQYLCWRDQYIARWYALAPLGALTPKARRRVVEARTNKPGAAGRRFFVGEEDGAREAFAWLQRPVLDQCLLHLYRSLGVEEVERWEMGRLYDRLELGGGVTVRVHADVITTTGAVYVFRSLPPEACLVPATVHLALLAVADDDAGGAAAREYRALDPVSGRCLILRVPAHRTVGDLRAAVTGAADMNQ